MAQTIQSKSTKTKKKFSLNSSDLNKHRRTFRDLNTLKIIDHTNVLALRVLEKKINQRKRQLKQLDTQIKNVDNKVTHAEKENFVRRVTSVLKEHDYIDREIDSRKSIVWKLSWKSIPH